MSLTIVSPPAENEWTGGYLYNARVVSQLRCGHVRCTPAQLSSFLPDGSPLVLDSLYLASVELSALRRLRQCGPVLWMVHFLGDEDPTLEARVAGALKEQIDARLPDADGWIVTSAWMGERLRARGCDPSRVHVVFPGLEDVFLNAASASGEARLHSETMRVVTVANLERRKGHAELLEALGQVPQSNWAWELIGHGSEADVNALLSRAAALGISGRVKWQGARAPDFVADAYRRSDVFALLTHYEPFGMVFAEAMAMGLPIVATRVGELPRLVEHGVSGMLASPGDVPEAAHALQQLIQDGAARERMGTQARSRAARFGSWADCARRFAVAVDTVRGQSERRT